MMGTWTLNEIEAYQPVEGIENIYTRGEIGSSASPETKSKYLAETFLNLGMLDHDLIMRTAKKEGRHVALNLLENIALAHAMATEN